MYINQFLKHFNSCEVMDLSLSSYYKNQISNRVGYLYNVYVKHYALDLTKDL